MRRERGAPEAATLRLRVLWDGHEQVVWVSEPVGLETPSTHGW